MKTDIEFEISCISSRIEDLEEKIPTKRELFAAMAMQGLLACSTENWNMPAEDVANEAVTHANALLKALEEN